MTLPLSDTDDRADAYMYTLYVYLICIPALYARLGRASGEGDHALYVTLYMYLPYMHAYLYVYLLYMHA